MDRVALKKLENLLAKAFPGVERFFAPTDVLSDGDAYDETLLVACMYIQLRRNLNADCHLLAMRDLDDLYRKLLADRDETIAHLRAANAEATGH